MTGRLLAIGDIHGCYTELVQMIEQELKLTIDDKFIFLGDYIDRGPQSKEVLDYIIKLIDEENTLAQAKKLANLPVVHKHVALMPDAHSDYGMPIDDG